MRLVTRQKISQMRHIVQIAAESAHGSGEAQFICIEIIAAEFEHIRDDRRRNTTAAISAV